MSLDDLSRSPQELPRDLPRIMSMLTTEILVLPRAVWGVRACGRAGGQYCGLCHSDLHLQQGYGHEIPCALRVHAS